MDFAGNKTKTVPHEVLAATTATSNGTKINFRFYFRFVLLLVASNLYG